MQSTNSMSIDLSGFGRRLNAVRRERGFSLQKLASRIGCDRSYLSRLETGKASNPSPAIVGTAAAVLGINEEWLRMGIGDPFAHPHIPDDFDVEFLSAFTAIVEEMSVQQILKVLHRINQGDSFPAAARAFWLKLFAPWLNVKIQAEAQSESVGVDEIRIKHHLSTMNDIQPRTWSELRSALRSKTQSAAAKTNLAELLGVTPAAISQWRSGAAKPSAENTLQILAWVRGVEVKPQQKKRAGRAETRPAQETHEGKSKHEKPKSDQKES